MPDGTWHNLCPATELPPGARICAHPADTPVVAFNVDGTLFGLIDRCPHAGLPLGDGELRGRTLTCPYHGYTFRLNDGADLDAPDTGEPATVLPVRTHGGVVQVRLP